MGQISDFSFNRYHVDLAARSVRHERVACEDLEDVLGGVARGFKLLAERPVDDAYEPGATLVCNLGILSGSEFMTGLRTFFHGYSPLKSGNNGKPGAMWSAGSGKFGTKLRTLDVDEILFVGRASEPVTLHIAPGPAFEFLPAADLAGKTINGKVQALHERFEDAHFAVIGPAGEHYAAVRYAAIGLSTENQLKSGDAKARFCGRGGFGGVMGSKNLFAIVADTPDRKHEKVEGLIEINKEVARGKGSRRFRDKRKGNGGGGTWANYEAMNPSHIVPENNFQPTGTDASFALHRPMVEQGPWTVKDESCYRCGIACHKNVYDKDGGFRAKLDYEPLNLLSSNLGVFDVDEACDLVELVDELGMDSISCGASVSFAMEYNRRHPDAPIAGGVAFGDAAAAARVIREIAAGELPLLGEGTKRAGQETGAPEFAMHCKGVEFPAYLPQTNPGYPWALAGGHMSMSTYLLLLYEKETGLDYWVEAITGRGIKIMRDDLLGICKFAGMSDKSMVEAVRLLAGLEVTPDELQRAVRRTYLRGYAIEKAQGFDASDYDMPADAHEHNPNIELPYFNTKEFFAELKERVGARFEAMLDEEAL